MKRQTLKLLAELSLVTGSLAAEVRALPDDVDLPCLEAADLAIRDAIANLTAVQRTVHAPPPTTAPCFPHERTLPYGPYQGPQPDDS